MFEITEKNKWRWIIGAYLLVLVPYLFNNHFRVFEAHTLPLTPLDWRMPFLPWTGWIYSFVYFFPLVLVVVIKDLGNLRSALLCALVTSTLCNLVFFFYPTIYPRPTDSLEGLINWPLKIVQLLDTPANCFPSAHVAFAFISAFYMEKEHRLWGQAMIFAAVLISISTLTTKQHYTWDVVAGYVLARVAFKLVNGRALK